MCTPKIAVSSCSPFPLRAAWSSEFFIFRMAETRRSPFYPQSCFRTRLWTLCDQKWSRGGSSESCSFVLSANCECTWHSEEPKRVWKSAALVAYVTLLTRQCNPDKTCRPAWLQKVHHTWFTWLIFDLEENFVVANAKVNRTGRTAGSSDFEVFQNAAVHAGQSSSPCRPAQFKLVWIPK